MLGGKNVTLRPDNIRTMLNQLFIGGSIGISIFPEHGIDADTLIKNADSAMYEVKLKGGNGYKIYSS